MRGYKEKNNGKVVVTSGRTLDHVARVYDILNPIMTFFQEGRISERVMELIELEESSKILDIGCGTGSLTVRITGRLSAMKKDFLVVGVDAAPKMIAVAREKSRTLKNIRFDIEAAEDLPYRDDSFDSVVSTFFFHHVNYELKKRSLREIWRVVKKGGRVVIVDVDIPVNFFGTLCARCGYILFRQDEIKENIEGKLREAINACEFKSWHKISTHLGYISIFKLRK